ncbi:MAG: 6-bladed beta-propeller [Tannerella sp.]|jgi:hypothetical protein|nr:6-bladed beta-propeller [Tannerella sp.]
MKRISLFFLTISLLASSCNRGKDGEQLLKIPFAQAVDKAEDFPLSHLALSLEYVPLETIDSSLISHIQSVRATKDFFFVRDIKGLLQFDRHGKFLRRIGSQGKGPGQYTFLKAVAVNEKAGLLYLYVYMQQKALVYDFKGNFLREIPVPDNHGLRLLNDSILTAVLSDRSGGMGAGGLELANLQGKTLKKFPCEDAHTQKHGDAFLEMVGFTTQLYRFGGNLFYKYGYGDTVCQVTPKALLPRYVVEAGKYALPPELRYDMMNGDAERFSKETSQYMRMGFMEFTDYVLMPYTGWGNLFGTEPFRLAVYNKKTGNCFSVKGDTLPNDMDHLQPFYPDLAIDDNSALMICPAAKLFARIQKLPKNRVPPVLQKLKEDDNPILLLVHLK